jgi:hypothetical protein
VESESVEILTSRVVAADIRVRKSVSLSLVAEEIPREAGSARPVRSQPQSRQVAKVSHTEAVDPVTAVPPLAVVVPVAEVVDTCKRYLPLPRFSVPLPSRSASAPVERVVLQLRVVLVAETEE